MSLVPTELFCPNFRELDGNIEMLLEASGSEWVFRGQTDARWDLAPRLERQEFGLDVQKAAVLERRMAGEFKAKAHLYSSNGALPIGDDWYVLLSMMQHYRVPTRLLDWSYSPYIGLFFAVEEKRELFTVPVNRALWALNATSLHTASDRAAEAHKAVKDKVTKAQIEGGSFTPEELQLSKRTRDPKVGDVRLIRSAQ